jgi:hypothetical protein
VTGHDLACAIHQDRRVEGESLDAAGDRLDLRRLVKPGVLRIERQRVERNVL